jgi:hypothetical protein
LRPRGKLTRLGYNTAMSRRLQFSLGRLFGALTLVAIAAMSAANLARASNNAGISAAVLWMVTTCGAAGGILISKSVLRGLIVGALIGLSPGVAVNLVLLVFAEWSPVGLQILLLGALVVAAFFSGIHFEREQHRPAKATDYVQVTTMMPQSVTASDDPAVQTDEVAIPAPATQE